MLRRGKKLRHQTTLLCLELTQTVNGASNDVALTGLQRKVSSADVHSYDNNNNNNMKRLLTT
jgi:hypothetical protein